MKKLLLILGITAALFGKVNYTGKVIGAVNIPGFFDGGTLTVFCINGVQYMGDISSKYQSSLSPIYGQDGKIKTCK